MTIFLLCFDTCDSQIASLLYFVSMRNGGQCARAPVRLLMWCLMCRTYQLYWSDRYANYGICGGDPLARGVPGREKGDPQIEGLDLFTFLFVLNSFKLCYVF